MVYQRCAVRFCRAALASMDIPFLLANHPQTCSHWISRRGIYAAMGSGSDSRWLLSERIISDRKPSRRKALAFPCGPKPVQVRWGSLIFIWSDKTMRKGVYHIEMMNAATKEARQFNVAADDLDAALAAGKSKLSEIGMLEIIKIELVETVSVV